MFVTLAHEKPLGVPEWVPSSARAAAKLLSLPLDCADVMLEGLYWREAGSSLWGIVRNDLLRMRG